MMEILHDTSASRFVAQEEEITKGELLYSRSPEGWIDAYSTRVPPAYGGQGIARRLLDALVAWAREEGLPVRPTCSYVARCFEKEPEVFRDVLP